MEKLFALWRYSPSHWKFQYYPFAMMRSPVDDDAETLRQSIDPVIRPAISSVRCSFGRTKMLHPILDRPQEKKVFV